MSKRVAIEIMTIESIAEFDGCCCIETRGGHCHWVAVEWQNAMDGWDAGIEEYAGHEGCRAVRLVFERAGGHGGSKVQRARDPVKDPDEFNSVAVDWECGLGKGVPCLTPREDCEGCEHQRLAPRPGNRPWLQPNDHGEPPGGICCQRATGDHCYEHDKDNWVRVDGHWRPYARHLVKPRKAKADEG